MPVPNPVIPYDPHFLGAGIEVPLPEPSDELRPQLYTQNGTHILDYTHFSLAIHRKRHTAVYSACNIDGLHRVMGISRKGIPWVTDDRAGDFQIGNEAYRDTAWDRGHLTRREDVIWGSPTEAKAANRATFYYTNAAPQHENFNQDEWNELEDWVLDWADEHHYRLCVITGPVLSDDDRRLSEGDPELRRVELSPDEILIPAAFWKIVALRDKETRELAVAAFAMRQSEFWNDHEGRKLLRLSVHQVTVRAIEEWTGLSFGPLGDSDVLSVQESLDRFARSAEGEAIWPIIRSPEDLVRPSGERRGSDARSALASDITPSKKKSGCNCEGGTGDVQTAVASLSEDVARLTAIVAKLAKEAAPAGEGSADVTRAVSNDLAAPEDDATLSDDERVARVLSRVRMRTDATRSAASAAFDLTRIVGGEDVEPGEYPATCCLGSFDRYFCTGVLVHPRVIVTAAHCGSNIVFAFFGDVIPSKGGEGKNIRVKSAVVHPNYDPKKTVRNDISVLILSEDGPAKPVRIATTAEIAAMTDVQLVGFGYNDPMKPLGFGQKRKVVVPVGAVRRKASEDLKALEQTFGFSSNHEFVAGRKLLGRDSCNGDSGGPAYITTSGLRVVGVTSRATKEAAVNCGDGGIYVRLDTYLDFIKKTAQGAGITDFQA